MPPQTSGLPPRQGPLPVLPPPPPPKHPPGALHHPAPHNEPMHAIQHFSTMTCCMLHRTATTVTALHFPSLHFLSVHFTSLCFMKQRANSDTALHCGMLCYTALRYDVLFNDTVKCNRTTVLHYPLHHAQAGVHKQEHTTGITFTAVQCTALPLRYTIAHCTTQPSVQKDSLAQNVVIWKQSVRLVVCSDLLDSHPKTS